MTLIQVMEWMRASGQLEDEYHIGESNCQHFAGWLWSQLSDKAIPPPRHFNQPIQSIDNDGSHRTNPKSLSPSGTCFNLHKVTPRTGGPKSNGNLTPTDLTFCYSISAIADENDGSLSNLLK